MPSDASGWSAHTTLAEEPGAWLLITGFDNQHVISGTARLLVPMTAGGDDLVLGVSTTRPIRAEVLVNGALVSNLVAEAGAATVPLSAAWRAGWNVVELRGADGLQLTSLNRGVR